MSVGSVLIKAASNVKFFGIKNAPELLLGGAIIAGGAALYFAGKNTISAQEVIARHKEKMDEIQEAIEVADEGEFTEKDVKINKVRVWANTIWELSKCYAPTIIFVLLTLTLVLTSHGILKHRNIVLATTLAGVREAFNDYRSRVVRDLGQEYDEHFLYDTQEVEKEITVIDEKTGKEKTKKIKVKQPTKVSDYARFYDESCKGWSKDGGANYNFVRAKMVSLQDKLVAQGFLFLNDVYTALGMDITVKGQSAGWIYDPNDKRNTLLGFKGFDSFGCGFDLSERVADFMNGNERNCLIDFENLRDDILTDLPRVNSKVATI